MQQVLWDLLQITIILAIQHKMWVLGTAQSNDGMLFFWSFLSLLFLGYLQLNLK